MRRRNLFLAFLASPLFFMWSYFLLAHYTMGDQVYYLRLWEALQGSHLTEALALSQIHVSSSEPLAALVLWFGANLGIEKNFYVSLLNIGLGVGLFFILYLHKAPCYVYFLVFSNFYLIVLMTSAERLKIAYIFIFFSALLPHKYRFGMAALTPLAHFQSLIFLASLVAIESAEALKRFLKNFVLVKQLIFVLCFTLSAPLLFSLLEYILLSKITLYLEESRGFSELWQISALGIIGTLATKSRLRMLAALAPLTIAIYLLGGTRANMIAVTVVLYLLLIEGRISHPLALLLMVYLSAKSVPFVINILTNGDGFDGYLF